MYILGCPRVSPTAPGTLPAKSVHPSQPPGWQTPPPLPGRRYLAERLSRGFWPASPFFLPFFALSFWFCRPRSGRLHHPAAWKAGRQQVLPADLGAYFLLLPPGHAAGRCPPARPGSLCAFFSVFVVYLSFALSFVSLLLIY